ncbi:MAG: type III pantothenate kinase [Candidatus Dadabacteria bacterium]|nr:MAG: type III pantothenate kinase [Candidatus Dadabacteria bacterium]
MLLTVDIGNTQTVFGVYRGDELIEHGRFSSRRDWTSDELEIVLRAWLHQKAGNIDAIQGVSMCSVVPPTEHLVRDALSALLPEAPILSVGPGVRTGIAIRYENPKEVGADRIVNAVAAHHLIGGGVIVVDFGTAITFDCIGEDGAYLGGAISPGIHVSTEALFRNTAKLPRIDPEPPEHLIGRNTVESLQSGIFWGFLCLTEGMIDRLRNELGPVPVIATGGWAEAIGPHSSHIDEIEPWLTLEGLRLLWERNGERI